MGVYFIIDNQYNKFILLQGELSKGWKHCEVIITRTLLIITYLGNTIQYKYINYLIILIFTQVIYCAINYANYYTFYNFVNK